MAGLALVQLVGNLGRDPETKVLPSGVTVLEFSLATGRRDKNGVDRTTWFRVQAYARLAEVLDGLAQQGALVKGKQVVVSGRLDAREYEKDGQTRTSLDVNANEVLLVGSREGGDAAAGDRHIDEIPF